MLKNEDPVVYVEFVVDELRFWQVFVVAHSGDKMPFIYNDERSAQTSADHYIEPGFVRFRTKTGYVYVNPNYTTARIVELWPNRFYLYATPYRLTSNRLPPFEGPFRTHSQAALFAELKQIPVHPTPNQQYQPDCCSVGL